MRLKSNTKACLVKHLNYEKQTGKKQKQKQQHNYKNKLMRFSKIAGKLKDRWQHRQAKCRTKQ